MSINSVSQSGDNTFAFMSVYITSTARTSLSGIPYVRISLITLPLFDVKGIFEFVEDHDG